MSSASSRRPPAPTLGYLLKRAQHAFRTRLDEALRPLGLTAPQYAVLAAVAEVAGISNAELARAAFVTPQSMQGILANLERDGLLVRHAHPGHGRILRTELTDRGRDVLGRGRERVDEIQAVLAEAVGDQARLFAEMLTRCAERLGAP